MVDFLLNLTLIALLLLLLLLLLTIALGLVAEVIISYVPRFRARREDHRTRR